MFHLSSQLSHRKNRIWFLQRRQKISLHRTSHMWGLLNKSQLHWHNWRPQSHHNVGRNNAGRESGTGCVLRLQIRQIKS